MFRSSLLIALVCFSSACTAQTAVDEDPTAEDEGALPAGGKVKACGPQRWDFAISGGDLRTCAQFSKTTTKGTWIAFSTFPGAPASIRDKRCAVVFKSNADVCTRATKAELGMNCFEDHSLIERDSNCAKLGAACTAGNPTVMQPPRAAPIGPTEIESACRPNSAEPRLDQMQTYSGGCPSCGVLFGGRLFLTSPRPWAFVTYNNGGSPYIVGLDTLNGPVTYDLGPAATGPVMVSY